MRNTADPALSPTTTTLVLRKDLVQRKVHMGQRSYWVLKDPLSRAYFYITEREFAILNLLNGRRLLSDIATECANRFAPDFVSKQSIVRFLVEAKANGLIYLAGIPPKVSSNENAERTRARESQSLWANPLAIRFPGINPDRTLEPVAQLCRPLLKPAIIIAWFLLIGASAVVMVTHFDSYMEHLTLAAKHTSVSWWLTLMIAIASTKIVHELAHAVACKIWGAECRELGVMLLVGVPCLYCDVSDAWMLRERWKRIFVSSAGILAELTLAGVAIFVWQFIGAGEIRDLCVTLIVVCSVSTVVFNGNPLLRYDGYFILSDLISIPNLAGESRNMIRNYTRQWFWALPSQESSTADASQRHSFTLATYGILSGLYRSIVMFTIALIGYRLLDSVGLHTIGIFLLIGLSILMATQTLRPIVKPPHHSIRRSAMSAPRRVSFMFVCVGIVAVALLVPLPRYIKSPMTLRPANDTPIFVSTPGIIQDGLTADQPVRRGEIIAVLRNPQTARELAEQSSKQLQLNAKLVSLQQRQVSDRVAAATIPFASGQLAAAQSRTAILRAENTKLTIRAPRDGMFFSPMNRTAVERGKYWFGIPLSKSNRGAFLEQGTLLGSLGDAHQREAWLIVRQQDVELVNKNQSVTLLSAAHPNGTITGKVIHVAATPIPSLPAELIAAHLVEPPSPTIGIPTAAETYYQVRVRVQPTISELAVRSTGHAQIHVAPASLFSRLLRSVRESLDL